MFNAIDNSTLNTTAFNAAIYVRLSREDDEKYQQSESIKNQIDFLTKTAIENSWNIFDIYIDDGYTGTNFDRPSFQRMIHNIEKKQVNLVIVKDLSRLGRDYIETGSYIEKYFPLKNIRFIALNDGIDTFSNSSSNDMGPFRNVMNDHYAKDISKKVRFSFNIKRYNGQFIGSFAPYGYQKDIHDKNKLVLNPETSSVVKKIFNLYVSGSALREIAILLNSEGILSPAAYKKYNTTYRGGRTKNFIWGPETIRVILSNPTYMGSIAQRKFEKINYKLKKFKSYKRDSWVVVNNTHEPIVEASTFELVQVLLEKKAAPYKNTESVSHLLSGSLYCGDCGSKMTFLTGSNGNVYAVCTKYKRFKQCTRHSFPEKQLNSIVVEELRQIAAKVLDQERLKTKAKAELEKSSKSAARSLTKDMDMLDKRLLEIKSFIRNLYEDKVKGILSESDFIELSSTYSAERENIYQRVEKIKLEMQKAEEHSIGSVDLIKIVSDFARFESPDRITLARLINKIQVFENKELKIHYNFTCPY